MEKAKLQPLVFPARSTKYHQQFLDLYPEVNLHHLLCVDVGAGSLAYDSECSHITLCSNERYALELHKFLLNKNAESVIREIWERDFGRGANKDYAKSVLHRHNLLNSKGGEIFSSWSEVAKYYCLLLQSGMSYYYAGKRLIVDLDNPTSLPSEELTAHYLSNKPRAFSFSRKGILQLPLSQVDNNTIIYFQIPIVFGQYGYGYVWSRRKLRFMVKEFTALAEEGYKVVISSQLKRYGVDVVGVRGLFPGLQSVEVGKSSTSKYGFDNSNTEIYFFAL